MKHGESTTNIIDLYKFYSQLQRRGKNQQNTCHNEQYRNTSDENYPLQRGSAGNTQLNNNNDALAANSSDPYFMLNLDSGYQTGDRRSSNSITTLFPRLQKNNFEAVEIKQSSRSIEEDIEQKKSESAKQHTNILTQL